MGQRAEALRTVRARGLGAAIALAAALPPCAALSSPDVVKPVSATQETVATQGAAVTHRLSTETLRGTVASVDQDNDTLRIRLSPETTEVFRVQDGLIFDVVRYGDQVEIIVQDIAGTKTIVGLSKE